MPHTGTVRVRVNGRDKEVPFAIDDARNPSSIGVLLAHGAGGDLSSGTLPAFAAALAAIGPCLRFTCRGPLPHRVAVAEALLAAPPTAFPSVTRWILAGHSMGGRVAAQLAHELPRGDVSACLLLSYPLHPLHPPGRPIELRDDPLVHLTLPVMFVRGTRDPFNTDGPWAAVRRRLRAAPAEVHEVEGGDHGLRVAGAYAEDNEAALRGALDAAAAFAGRVARGDGDGGSGGTKRRRADREGVLKSSRKVTKRK